MLAVIDSSGQRTGHQAAAFIALLFLCTLLPACLGLSGPAYLVGAVALGSAFLAFGIHFARMRDRLSARRLFVASALYLPAVLVLMILDKLL